MEDSKPAKKQFPSFGPQEPIKETPFYENRLYMSLLTIACMLLLPSIGLLMNGGNVLDPMVIVSIVGTCICAIFTVLPGVAFITLMAST